jgi:hypothetical protein
MRLINALVMSCDDTRLLKCLLRFCSGMPWGGIWAKISSLVGRVEGPAIGVLASLNNIGGIWH